MRTIEVFILGFAIVFFIKSIIALLHDIAPVHASDKIVIHNYKDLKFFNDTHVNARYGQRIKIYGIGVEGIMLYAQLREDNICLTPDLAYSWPWLRFIQCFPEYEHDVLMIASPEYKARHEALTELSQLEPEINIENKLNR